MSKHTVAKKKTHGHPLGLVEFKGEGVGGEERGRHFNGDMTKGSYNNEKRICSECHQGYEQPGFSYSISYPQHD